MSSYKIIPLSLCFVGSAICFDTVASAQNAVEPSTTLLERIVVGEGQQSSLEARRRAPNSVIVLDQKQIERFGEVTAGGILRHLPGVVFGGAPGENKDVRIRGLDKEYSQVLINGRRVPGGGEKREFQFDRLAASLIERIEVIRTPTADMDSQGIAGTINIILKKAPQETTFNLTVGGSQIQGKSVKPSISMDFGGQKDNFGYLFSMNAQQRQFIKDKVKNAFKADGSANGTETETEDKTFDELQFAPQLSWTLPNANVLTVEPLYLYSDEKKVKDKFKFKADGSGNGSETEVENKSRVHHGITTEFLHTFPTDDTLKFGFSIQENTENKNKEASAFKADGSLDKITNENEDKTDREWLLSLKGTKYIGEIHTIKSGIEFGNKDRTKDKIKTETKGGVTKVKTEPKDSYQINEQRFNAYVLDEIQLSPKHLITPGIRFEWTDTEASNGGSFDKSVEDANWNPSLHYLYKYSDQTNFRASAARTVRRPKFDDLTPFVETKDGTLAKPDKVGNPDLVPEISWGFDVGATHYFADGAGNIGVNLFYRMIDDKIESRTSFNAVSGRYEETNENIGEGTLQGIEFDASYQMDLASMQNVTLTGNVTFLESEVTDKLTGVKRPFKEIPDYTFNIGFEHDLKYADLSWGMDYKRIPILTKDEIKDGKRTLEEIEAQDFLSMHIVKSLGENLELRFSAHNLLNTGKNKDKTSWKSDGSIDKIERETESTGRVFFVSLSRRW